ncbi:hypothetical protein ACFL6L_01425 [candidate division KSB1 bacterium]
MNQYSRKYVLAGIFFTGVIFALLYAGQSGLLAQQPNVSVESRLDTSTVTIGQHVTYEIIIRFTEDVLYVAAPPPGITLGGFEIRDYNDNDPEKKGDYIEKRVEFVIAAYDTGTYVIPPTGVAYMLPDSTQDVLVTDALTIRVESVLPGEADDILDIKNTLSIPKSWILTIIIAAAGLLLLLAALIIYMYYRRKKGKKLFEFRKEPDRPPHEIAIEALNRLRDSTLIADGKVKEYYSILSEILRIYLEGRYFKPFPEMTTAEIKLTVINEDMSGDVREMLCETLDLCDLVKFAKFTPDAVTHDSALHTAFDVVEATKIVLFTQSAPITATEETSGENTEGMEAVVSPGGAEDLSEEVSEKTEDNNSKEI